LHTQFGHRRFGVLQLRFDVQIYNFRRTACKKKPLIFIDLHTRGEECAGFYSVFCTRKKSLCIACVESAFRLRFLSAAPRLPKAAAKSSEKIGVILVLITRDLDGVFA